MCDKISHRCGTKQYAVCVAYEGELPSFSALTDECVSVEETTDDLYTIVGGIKNEIDLSNLDLECLTLSNPTVKTLFQLLITNICTLQSTVEAQAVSIGVIQQQITDLQESNCP